MSPTRKHHSKKHRRTQRSGGGRKNAKPFANGVPEGQGTFANVSFSQPWFKDIPESNKGTLTGFKMTEGSSKVMTGTLTVNVSDVNMKKFKIPGLIVVPMVKFEKTGGYSHGAYLKIMSSAIERPDIRSVSYVPADNDFFELTSGGGGPGLGGLHTGATDTANTVNTGATKFFSGKL